MDRQLLIKMYCDESLACLQIASHFGVSKATVYRAIKKFNLTRNNKNRHLIDRDLLFDLYITKNFRLVKVSEILGENPRKVRDHLQRHGIKKPSSLLGTCVFIDRTGNRYGRLTVLHKAVNKKAGRIMWVCKCDCGTVKAILGQSLQNGSTVSCGCYNKEVISGANNLHWKGGITIESERIRKSLAYKYWRVAVFDRDDYTCQICGQKDSYLEAHHIKNFAQYPEERLVVSNGITLCGETCHKEFHKKYGRKYNNITQIYREWINNGYCF